MNILNILFLITIVNSYSLLDMSQYDSSDWDPSLYGKPVCMNIPSNMSLCQNINYNQMKMPNLLGHDTIEEVVYQSSVWNPLLSVNCHKDTQLFLCSMFAPVCVEQAQAVIYPCRSLCESVKQSCEGPMLSYNYPWPSMFNCSRFPEDNGLCIPSSSKLSTEEPTTTTITTKTTTTTTTTTTTKTAKPKEDLILNDQTCFACDEDNLNMEQIVYGYCKSDIVLRARIQTIKISRLDLVNLKPKERNLFNRNNKTKSLYVKLSKRDRKVMKGGKLLGKNAISSYVRETEEDEFDSRELNMYLMSNLHLKLAGVEANKGVQSREPSLMANKKRTRNLNSQKEENNLPRKRFLSVNHCVCERLRKGARRINTKYLLMANVLKSRNLQVTSSLRRRSEHFTEFRDHNSTLGESIRKREEPNHTKLIYLTNVVLWNKARAFIDYLEDDSIDKTNMCKNIKKTVSQITKAQNMLF